MPLRDWPKGCPRGATCRTTYGRVTSSATKCPDLTSHASQVRDWYGSEDGLDLSALAADCAAFERVMAATEQALVMQDDELVSRCRVRGRATVRTRHGSFLRRHGEASRRGGRRGTYGRRCAGVRCRTGCGRRSTERSRRPLAVEDRVAQRAEWLAAAQTVMTGAGDRDAASELVDQQVKPFSTTTFARTG